MRQSVRTLALTLTVLAFSTAAFASTFLQFTEAFPFNTPVTITANGAGTQSTISVVNKAVNVTFDPAFCLIVGCGGVVNGVYNLNLSATSTGPATSNGTDITQNYAGTFSFTSGAINLLTVNFSDILSGSVGGGNPTLASSQPPDTFNGSSTVLDPAKLGIPRGFSFSLSNLTGGGLGIAPGTTTVRSGVADIAGTINATAPAAVPEPASLMLLGSGLAFVARRVRKVKQ